MTRYRATHIRPARDHTYAIVVICLTVICVSIFAFGVMAGIAAHR